MPAPNISPPTWLIVSERRGRVFYEAAFRHSGRQVKRRIGPAWLERDQDGGWRRRRGRVAEGFYDQRSATVEADRIVRTYVAEEADRERDARGLRARGPTFRELAGDYIRWLEDVKRAKPSTLRQHRSDLAEPDRPYTRGWRSARGAGRTRGYILRALGDKPAREVTSADVEALLASVAAGNVSARTVNRVRAVTSAVFSYGVRHHGLPSNPVSRADRHTEPRPGPLVYYSPEEVEALARALDGQDAEAVRLAAYAGLRLGELLALRWGDIDWEGSALTVSRALSAGVETSTKSGHVRRVPLSDQAAAALERLSRREHFTSPDDLVLSNELGRHLDGSALRRRYKLARDRAGLRPLRWHDLRHTFGSRLAASGVDLVTIKSAMGHADLKTTERYLHAKPTTADAARFTAAFQAAVVEEARLG
jgi:integrase